MDLSLYCTNGPWDWITLGLFVAVTGTWASAHATAALMSRLQRHVWPRLEASWIGRKRRQHALANEGGALVDGQVRRLRGFVEAELVVNAELSGLPAVVCKHELAWRQTVSAGRGLVARDFIVRLPDGTAVRVRAEDAAKRHALRTFDVRRHRWLGGPSGRLSLCESRLGPGDEVEILARVERRISPAGARLGGRSAPLEWMAVPADGEPLLIVFSTLPADPHGGLGGLPGVVSFG